MASGLVCALLVLPSHAQASLFTTAPGSPFPSGESPWTITAGDFNGDGRQDVAFANSPDDLVRVFLGDGTGAFSEPPGSPINVDREPHQYMQPYGLAAGDFNEDGLDDLAVS